MALLSWLIATRDAKLLLGLDYSHTRFFGPPLYYIIFSSCLVGGSLLLLGWMKPPVWLMRVLTRHQPSVSVATKSTFEEKGKSLSKPHFWPEEEARPLFRMRVENPWREWHFCTRNTRGKLSKLDKTDIPWFDDRYLGFSNRPSSGVHALMDWSWGSCCQKWLPLLVARSFC